MKQLTSAIAAGALIGIAATTYLRLGGVAGMIMFAFGLLGVVYYKLDLFTGQARHYWGAQPKRPYRHLLAMLGLNIAGCAAMAAVSASAEYAISPADIVSTRLATGPMMVAVKSIPCGFIMTLAVSAAADKNYLPLLFGIPTFIACGFPHCVADVYYYAADGNTIVTDTAPVIIVYLATVIGNFLGCNIYRSFAARTQTIAAPSTNTEFKA